MAAKQKWVVDRASGALLGTLVLMFSLPTDSLIEVQREVFLMSTRCALMTYSSSHDKGLEQLESFIRILEEAEQELSTWQAESLLSRLNRQPLDIPFNLHPRLCRLFSELFRWHSETGGAFDPAIGSLIEAWGVRDSGNLPSSARLEAARMRSGLHHFTYDRRACRLSRSQDCWIDTGSFGKGEALDRVHEHAFQAGGGPWMIDLGGQIMAQGSPPGQHGWKVGLADPADRNKVILELRLKQGSLATSGGSERDSSLDGIRVGHILDPRTGRPAPFHGSVTVWHPQALAADILSTALFVMGPQEGLSWANSRQVAACFISTAADDHSYEITVSRAFSSQFTELTPDQLTNGQRSVGERSEPASAVSFSGTFSVF